MDVLKDRGHIVWVIVAVLAVVAIWAFTSLIGYLVAHTVMWTVLGGLIYWLDFKFTKMLGTQRMQFVLALLLAVICGFMSRAPLWMTLILAVCDVVILMCVFSLSAAFWPNAAVIEERLRTDPFGAARDGFHGGVDALKRGARGARDEADGLRGHFRTPPASTPPAAS